MSERRHGEARLRVVILGAVQGVGFRPFVHRLATDLGLAGFVANTGAGLVLEAEGPLGALDELRRRLDAERPPLARVTGLEATVLDPAGRSGFEIRASAPGGPRTALVLPDIATCEDCLREVLDPGERRHRYPFATCTRCGPRYTIVERLPYDRPNTSMRRFPMCDRCRAEYEDPGDRRFHAQPIACPDCGPRLDLWAPDGSVLAARDDALRGAARAVLAGATVAVKGLGGFHLVCDARDEAAVLRLRERKRRAEKPFAVMVGALDAARALAALSEAEARLLAAPEAPIVLLARLPTAPLARAVAPGHATVGLMLPATPLHHLLLREVAAPVVATSGNLSEEPLCTDEREALARLAGVADLFLVHDRPIVRPVDDSVARVVLGREMLLRRARGYAPLPVAAAAGPDPASGAGPVVLAVGGHLKNAVAWARGAEILLSPHVGDLDGPLARAHFRATVEAMGALIEARPEAVACDAHPDYASTRHARATGLPVVEVQHHHAHALACLAEAGWFGPALGVAWDGTGWGPDGTVWGGEFLRVDGDAWERVLSWRTFPLPGGEAAVREPRRSALGVLAEMDGIEGVEHPAFRPAEARALARALAAGVNCPRTSSVGRLFDAAASFAGLRQRCSYEGQAAMEWEQACDGVPPEDRWEVPVAGDRLDWAPMMRGLRADLARGLAVGRAASAFHEALAAAVVTGARRAGLERVALSGGCFQNRRLLERTVERLRAAGFRPAWPQRVPPGDGGIAVGQAVAARLRLGRMAGPCASPSPARS